MDPVIVIPALGDNFAYLFRYEENQAIAVDPADAGPVLNEIRKHDLELTDILVSHHHWDHTAGIEELKHKTAAQLKEIAAGIEHEAVQGYTQLNKDHLIKAICTALNIDMHEHHEVVGVDKKEIKVQIRELKKDRDKALEAHDHKKLKSIRKEIKGLKNKLRQATV